MITLFVVAVNVFAYLYTGLKFALPMHVERGMAYNRENYPTLAKDPRHVQQWKTEVVVEGLFCAVMWPFYMLIVSFADGYLKRLTNRF